MGTRAAGTSSPSSDRWLQAAVRYLARADRSAAQVEHFLRNKGATPAQARRTVARLSDLRYLDDRAYGERWVETRLSRQPLGRERLAAELRERGLAEPLADSIVREALGAAGDESWARRALQARERRGRKLAPPQAARLLRQWGFEEESIERIIEERRVAEGSDL